MEKIELEKIAKKFNWEITFYAYFIYATKIAT